jgi:hypothetical protein
MPPIKEEAVPVAETEKNRILNGERADKYVDLFMRFHSGSGDEYAEIILEDGRGERRKYVPWAFRANNVLAKWFGAQMGNSSTFTR